MSELTEFLLARIAEDEDWARAAELGKSFDPIEWPTEGEPDHPARVLAECAAKRQIVQLHEPVEVYRGRPLVCAVCVPVDDSGNYVVERPEDMFPCPTLRALASPYAGQPGWREEWR